MIPFMSQVVRSKFGNTNLRKLPPHPFYCEVGASSSCSNNTGVLWQQNHWQLEHQEGTEQVQITSDWNSSVQISLHCSVSLQSCTC